MENNGILIRNFKEEDNDSLDNKTILDSVKYAYFNHSQLQERMSLIDTLKFFDMCSNRLIVEKEDGIIKGVAMFMKLTDDSLNDVLQKNVDYSMPGIFKKMISEDGEHIHFIGVVADGLKFIRRGIRKIIDNYNPETISWIIDLKIPEKIFFMTLRR